MPVTSWSTTPALNTLDSGTAGSGGTLSLDGTVMKPSEVDNAFRSIMAQIAAFTFGETTLTSTDSSATAGPTLTLYRNSVSPVASDIIGRILFQGEDSAGNTEDYAEDYVSIVDTTSTSEDASRLFRIKVAGTMTTVGTASATGWTFPGAITAGAGSFTTLAASGAVTFTNVSDGVVGPIANLVLDTTTPANNDITGMLKFFSRDSAANLEEYGTFYCLITDPTSGSEDSTLAFRNVVAGALTIQATVTATGWNGMNIGATTPGTGAFTTLSATGALTISGAGAGQIVFPASQNASANANTFDDYEEGTFTPTIIGTSAAGVGTYSAQVGTYTKIGRSVQFAVNVIWSAHTGTGNMKVAALPFTADGSAANPPVSLYVTALTFPASILVGYVEQGNTTIWLGTAATGAATTQLAIDAAATVYAAGQYFV
jgi:hypothetical protein